jgi:GR25 family glycosyltransferase involved in LPS biosynthesis
MQVKLRLFKRRPSIERRSFTCIFQFISALKIETERINISFFSRQEQRELHLSETGCYLLILLLEKERRNLTELIS